MSRLRARRYERIVLPFLTLATGDLAYGTLAKVPDVINGVRLADCLAVLEEAS